MSESEEIIIELLDLLDYHIERAKPSHKCPDRIAAWNAAGHKHRSYRRAVEYIQKNST